MIKKILKLSLLFLGLGSGTLYALPNGTWLLSTCSSLITTTAPTPNNDYCVGLIQGVMLSWYTAEQQVNPKGATVWMSLFGDVPALETAHMVVKYMGQNPQVMHDSAVSIIIAAINQNYPIPPASGS